MIQHKAPRVTLKPNVQKILAAVTHVIVLAEKRRLNVTQYDLIKSIFIADKSHLNKYGRPITFDNYYAMRAGPVPSLTYNILKENKRAINQYNIIVVPWTREAVTGGRYYYTKPNPGRFEGLLSESDKVALEDAFNIVNGLTFGQIKRLTHADPAYIEAWSDDDERNAYEMSFGMLFDSPDYEQAEAIEFLSKHT